MTYQGTVRNGVVIFSGAAPSEGTRVRIQPIDPTEALPGAAAPSPAVPGDPRVIAAAGLTWAGGDEELDRLLAEVQQLREQDLKWEQEMPGPR
jgi:hypothetical protein